MNSVLNIARSDLRIKLTGEMINNNRFSNLNAVTDSLLILGANLEIKIVDSVFNFLEEKFNKQEFFI
jgi:hypothetical protein